MFLVRKNETNIGDQRLLEFRCLELEKKLKTARFSFEDLFTNLYLTEEKKLFM
jgi:hypothetical protein